MKVIHPKLELQFILNARGFMLVASLLVTAIIVTLGVAVSYTVMNNSLIARNVSETTQARYQADGGIDAVLGYLRSGQLELEFDPDPEVVKGAPTYTIVEDSLQDNINEVLVNSGLEAGTVTILVNDLITPPANTAQDNPANGSPPAVPTGPAITPANGWSRALATSNSAGEGAGCYSDGSDGFAAAEGHTYRFDNRNNPEGMLIYITDPATNKTTEIKFDPNSAGDTRNWYAHPTRSGALCSQNMSCEAYDLNGNKLPDPLFARPFGNNTAAMGSCLCTSDTAPPAAGSYNPPGTGGCPTFSEPPTIACAAGSPCGAGAEATAGGYPPSSVYLTLNSTFKNAIGTRSNRNATVELVIDWTDTKSSSIDVFYGVETEKGCQINGSTTIDTDMYCGTEITFNGPLLNSNKEAVNVKTGPNLTTCNSNQKIGGEYVYCDKGQLANAKNVLDEARIVETPTPNEVRDTALSNLGSELNIPADTEDFGAYINNNKVVISPNQVNQNNSAQFNTTLTAAILAAGGGSNGCSQGTVVYLTGGIAIPGGVNLNNCIFVVQSGDLNFNGSGNHTNTVFITETGSMNFNGAHVYDNSSLISGNSVNLNNTPIFKDANGDGKSLAILSAAKGNLNINGAFKQQDEATELFIVSQGDINFNGASKSTAGIITGGNVRFNGKGGLTGFVRSRGTVTMNGGIDTKDFNDPFRNVKIVRQVFPVFLPEDSPARIVTRQ